MKLLTAFKTCTICLTMLTITGCKDSTNSEIENKAEDTITTHKNGFQDLNEQSSDQSEEAIAFLDKYKERMMMMPASSKNWHHSAFAGGYTDHVLRVYDCANQLYKTWKSMGGDISTYTIEEMHFVALFHDLGKMGQQEGEYYQPNDSLLILHNQLLRSSYIKIF